MVAQVGHRVAAEPLGTQFVHSCRCVEDIVLEFNYKVIPKGDTVVVYGGGRNSRNSSWCSRIGMSRVVGWRFINNISPLLWEGGGRVHFDTMLEVTVQGSVGRRGE